MLSKTITLEGREIILTSSYEVNQYIKNIEDLINKIEEPFIFDAATLENRILNISLYMDDYLFIVHHILVEKLAAITGRNNLWDIVEYIAEEDMAWGEWRNKDLTAKRYYKYTIKPEFQAQIKDFLTDLLNQLKVAEKEIKEEEQREAELKRQRQNRFTIVNTYKLVYPRGGEFGIDGYADFELLDTQTEKKVRMVARNVFDFGYYCYPKRLEGTDQIFDKNTWTKEEKEAEKWLREFPPFTTAIRM